MELLRSGQVFPILSFSVGKSLDLFLPAWIMDMGMLTSLSSAFNLAFLTLGGKVLGGFPTLPGTFPLSFFALSRKMLFGLSSFSGAFD
jgi:hypothetical protein